jgi:hypothetical protein
MPPDSVSVPSVVLPSWNVTVPVGELEDGGSVWTLARKVTV